MTPKLGTTIEDTISGVAGIAVVRTSKLGGQVQWGIQPKGDGKDSPSMWLFDEHHLKTKDDGLSANVPTFPETSISLGDAVEDKVSGFKATVIAEYKYLNGCIHYGLQAKVNKDGSLPEEVVMDWSRLRVAKKAKVAPLPEEPKIGGPSARMPRLV